MRRSCDYATAETAKGQNGIRNSREGDGRVAKRIAGLIVVVLTLCALFIPAVFASTGEIQMPCAPQAGSVSAYSENISVRPPSEDSDAVLWFAAAALSALAFAARFSVPRSSDRLRKSAPHGQCHEDTCPRAKTDGGRQKKM